MATRREFKTDDKGAKQRAGWLSRETRWRGKLTRDWWADAERLADKHRFFALSAELPGVPNKHYEGDDRPTILAISQAGTRQQVSKWESDSAADFDPLYDHLKSLRQQTKTAKTEYEGEPEKDWQPRGFPSLKGTPQQ